MIGYVIRNKDICKFTKDGDYYSCTRNGGKEALFLDWSNAKIFFVEEFAKSKIDELKKIKEGNYVIESF